MVGPKDGDGERAKKIEAMQRLVDEARTSGLFDGTMADIRKRAREHLDARNRT